MLQQGHQQQQQQQVGSRSATTDSLLLLLGCSNQCLSAAIKLYKVAREQHCFPTTLPCPPHLQQQHSHLCHQAASSSSSSCTAAVLPAAATAAFIKGLGPGAAAP
jgi:hypothetical protein